MTYPSKEEIERTKQGLRDLKERVKGDPELAREILASLDRRPLAVQPELTPLQRNEKLMQDIDRSSDR